MLSISMERIKYEERKKSKRIARFPLGNEDEVVTLI